MYYLSLGINATAIGILGAVYNFLSGFLGAPIGRISDRTGKYAELMFMGFLLIFLSGIFFILSFFNSDLLIKYVTVSIASLFLGSGLAFYHPLGGAILQLSYDKDEAPKALGINGSMGSLGRAIAPYVLVVLFDDLGVTKGILAVLIVTLMLNFTTYYGVNYPDLTDRASQFIETLTCGILFKYSTIAEAFSSLGVSPAFHRQSPFGHQ
jgi:Major Facilitator Superfamily.